MENGVNRMSRDLNFNGKIHTVKGNIKVIEAKFLLAQKADTIPQLLIAFTKFGILDDQLELFKIYQIVYVYSIGYLIERLKQPENKFNGKISQLISKTRLSYNVNETYEKRLHSSVDEKCIKYKNGIEYVKEQIKKKLQQKDIQNNNYYCQIQKTEESINYIQDSLKLEEYEKSIKNYRNMIQKKETLIQQLEQQISSCNVKLRLQCQQIENQDKYILKLKKQELKYIKLMGTISEFLQKITAQLLIKLNKKQEQNNNEEDLFEIFNRQIQSARSDYQKQNKLSNYRFSSQLNTKFTNLQNELTETKLLNQQIDDLIQAAEYLELDNSFKFD